MSENTLDEKLAELTDHLLNGENVAVPDDLADEMRVVRQLDRVIAPRDSVDPAFHMHLTQALTDEWDRQHQRKTQTMSKVIYFDPRYIAGLAAALVLVIAAVLLMGQGDSDGQLGFAGGSGDGVLIPVLVGVVAVIAAVAIYRWRQRR